MWPEGHRIVESELLKSPWHFPLHPPEWCLSTWRRERSPPFGVGQVGSPQWWAAPAPCPPQRMDGDWLLSAEVIAFPCQGMGRRRVAWSSLGQSDPKVRCLLRPSGDYFSLDDYCPARKLYCPLSSHPVVEFWKEDGKDGWDPGPWWRNQFWTHLQTSKVKNTFSYGLGNCWLSFLCLAPGHIYNEYPCLLLIPSAWLPSSRDPKVFTSTVFLSLSCTNLVLLASKRGCKENLYGCKISWDETLIKQKYCTKNGKDIL